MQHWEKSTAQWQGQMLRHSDDTPRSLERSNGGTTVGRNFALEEETRSLFQALTKSVPDWRRYMGRSRFNFMLLIITKLDHQFRAAEAGAQPCPLSGSTWPHKTDTLPGCLQLPSASCSAPQPTTPKPPHSSARFNEPLQPARQANGQSNSTVQSDFANTLPNNRSSACSAARKRRIASTK
jgi:hypothetical protein